MIGVCAWSVYHDAVREFFELFKTPWEFFRSDGKYDALIVCGQSVPATAKARLILIYGSAAHPWDALNNIQFLEHRDSAVLRCNDDRFPIHQGCMFFAPAGDSIAIETTTGRTVADVRRRGETIYVRLGFNLFSEVRFLLTRGQPACHAGIPTLELHIELLRKLVLNAGLPLLEIPPVPDGYDCIACLTHDVDHPSIRLHRFDHTMAGFIRRTLFDSPLRFLRGRIPLRHLCRNFLAVLKLPLIHLRLVADSWRQFAHYVRLERGLGSTFFVIPTRGTPGRANAGPGTAPKRRASAYGVADIMDEVRALQKAGAEVAVHGIDAWADSDSGSAEMQQVLAITGGNETGVRMHWLYFDEMAPQKLEAAGFVYDSTFGYNDTVGYRSGTGQVFKPLGASQLLELPLHIMDTALFFPSHLNATTCEAHDLTQRILEFATRFGGTVTVNWHDRSIFPERNWDGFYLELIDALRGRNAWFPTAAQATSWFRARRSATFVAAPAAHERIHATVTVDRSRSPLPNYRLRMHAPLTGLLARRGVLQDSGDFKDICFSERATAEAAQRLPLPPFAREQTGLRSVDSLRFSN